MSEGIDASAPGGQQESRPKMQKAPTFVEAFAVWTMTERSFHRKVNVLNGHSREGTDASASGGWQESRPKTQKALTFVKAFAVWTGPTIMVYCGLRGLLFADYQLFIDLGTIIDH